MKRLSVCDTDTLYLTLERIGVNVRELDKQDPSLEYLRELYTYLLYSQLGNWKMGKSHRPLIRMVNQGIVNSRRLTAGNQES